MTSRWLLRIVKGKCNSQATEDKTPADKKLIVKITESFCGVFFLMKHLSVLKTRQTAAQSQQSPRKIYISVAFSLDCIPFLEELLVPTMKQQNHQWYEQMLSHSICPQFLTVAAYKLINWYVSRSNCV